MMLHVISDAHLEFQRWRREWKIDTIARNVIVFAGDIGIGSDGLRFALTCLRPAIYVIGNHEVYGQRTVAKFGENARHKATSKPLMMPWPM